MSICSVVNLLVDTIFVKLAVCIFMTEIFLFYLNKTCTVSKKLRIIKLKALMNSIPK